MVRSVRKGKKNKDRIYSSVWDKILIQARQHPIHIRDVYYLIISKDDSNYIKRWMNYAGITNLNIQTPKFFRKTCLEKILKMILYLIGNRYHLKDCEKYFESNL